jgi:hypothetical protein
MLKGIKDYLKIGDHNSWCQRCGFKYKASELQKEWTGLLVCPPCLDLRHPQDLIRGVRETPPPKDQSPRNDGPSPLIPFTEDAPPVGFPPGKTTPLAGEADQAGTTYFVPFERVDGSKL